jgi:hypothetical protein
MKRSFSTFNSKILGVTILVVCKKGLTQTYLTDCKTITIEGEEKIFFGGLLQLLSMF